MGTPAQPLTQPVVLTIAGSDSGGGAGIQADLKTFMALGCHGASALTALTAQNTQGVTGIHEVDPAFVRLQIDAVATDMEVAAAKTGMLASAAIVEAVAEAVTEHTIPNLVVDPVFVSKSRHRLLAEDAVAALTTKLFPLARVVTPNLYEASALVGHEVTDRAAMAEAARALHALGARSVLVKGGHLPGDEAVDLLFDGASFHEVSGPRFDTRDTHGTGCTLSAAIAAHLAHGSELVEAVERAKAFVTGAIRRSLRIGQGYGPVNPAWDL
jgi:hydroxymethylpyrimidine/phosphomethylpyrimidine kinase